MTDVLVDTVQFAYPEITLAGQTGLCEKNFSHIGKLKVSVFAAAVFFFWMFLLLVLEGLWSDRRMMQFYDFSFMGFFFFFS